jgi:UPF0271 protein
MRTIDLNSDLGEGFGPWRMGDDAAILGVVSSANIACGGHAGDAATMVETLEVSHERGVVTGAHPGFADREGFGRRLIPMTVKEVEQLVATQVGALMGAAALAGARIHYVKPHGALGNWAADDRAIATAIVRATRAISVDLAILAISGTELEHAGCEAGLTVFSEIFADRGYLANGRLVPRNREGAMIHDADAAANRLVEFLSTGLMPTIDGLAIPLKAHSICVHGDSSGALAMARHIRQELEAAGIEVRAFLQPIKEQP